MTFRVYSCGYLSEEHERLQMTRLLGYLEQEFSQRNEDGMIIIEPAVPYSVQGRPLLRHPDAIIVKEGLFIAIELKPYEGDIIADCSYGAVWKSSDGEELDSKERINPFAQAGGHRNALLDFLRTGFVSKGNAPGWAKKDEDSLRDWTVRHVHSWVVTAEGSRPNVTGTDLRGLPVDTKTYPSFKVLSLDKVTNGLAFIRAPEPLFGPADMKRFLEDLKAKVTTRTEWARGALVEGQDRFLGMTPVITDWVDSGEYDGLDRSLKRIRELGLKPHLTHVIRIWHDKRYPDLRLDALATLIDWQFAGLGEVLNEALCDPNEDIVKFALEFLAKFGFPETINALAKLLREGPADLRPTAVQAIAASGGESACVTVDDFASSNLFDKPFRDYQYWFNRAGHAFENARANESEYEEFVRNEHDRMLLIRVCGAVIGAIGELNCKNEIPWLKRIIEEPTSMGFESDDYQVLDSIPSDYYGVFERVCKSLGKIGIGDQSISGLFIRRLPNAPEDYQWCIIDALGKLGDQAAVSALLPFVKSRESHLYDVTVSALSKLRSPLAFDQLTESYLLDPLDDSGRWTGEALENIDTRRFEDVLLNGITSGAGTDVKKGLLNALLPIASTRSVDVLFPLLRDPVLSNKASWILGNLARHNPEVFKRAKELTRSEDALEKASAILVLGDYYVKHIDELSAFEGEPAPVEVRRAILSLYEAAGASGSALKYAEDPDDEVRSSVFWTFRYEGGSYHGHFFICSSSGLGEGCAFIVSHEELAIQLRNKVFLIPGKSITRVAISNTESGRFGIYLETAQSGIEVRFLLVPTQQERFEGEQNRFMQSILDEIARIASNGVNRELTAGDNVVGSLWDAVPSTIEDRDNE